MKHLKMPQNKKLNSLQGPQTKGLIDLTRAQGPVHVLLVCQHDQNRVSQLVLLEH